VLTHEFDRGALVLLGLPWYLQHLAFIIDSLPEIHLYAVDLYKVRANVPSRGLGFDRPGRTPFEYDQLNFNVLRRMLLYETSIPRSARIPQRPGSSM